MISVFVEASTRMSSAHFRWGRSNCYWHWVFYIPRWLRRRGYAKGRIIFLT